MPTQRSPALCANRRRLLAPFRLLSAYVPQWVALSLAGTAPAGAAPRGAEAAGQPVPLFLLPLATVVGAPTQAASLVGEQLEAALRALPEVRLVREAASGASGRPMSAAVEAAQSEKLRAREHLEEADRLAREGRHQESALRLAEERERLLQVPLALDGEGGPLFARLLEQLALARMASGDAEGGSQALEERARLTVDPGPGGSRPPALQQALAAAGRRVLARARGSLRVLVPTGPPARVFLDGQLFGTTPLLLTDAPAGLHALRVERGGAAYAELVRIAPATERVVEPKLDDGAAGPLGELQAALSLGRLDGPTAGLAARLAKDAGARVAFVGAVAQEGEGLAVHSFLVAARDARVAALPRMPLGATRPGAAGAALLLSAAIQRELGPPRRRPGTAVRLPATFSAPSPEGSALAVISVAPPGEPPSTGTAPATVPEPAGVAAPPLAPPPPAVADPLEAAPAAPRAVAIPRSAPDPAPVPVARTRAPSAAAEAAREAAEAAPATPAATPTVSGEPTDGAPGFVVPLRPSSPPAAPRRSAMRPATAGSGPAPAAAVRPDVKPVGVAVAKEGSGGKGSRALWIVAGALLAGGLGAGGYLLYQSSRSPSSATIFVHVDGGP